MSVQFGDSRLPERFWDKVQRSASGCWIWSGSTVTGGYGSVRFGRATMLAHRVSYEQLVGEITKPQIDHLCRTPACVRPEHLEPVTCKVNNQRRNAVYTSCKNGHPYTEKNTLHSSRGRVCRTCRARYGREYRARKAAKRRSAA